MKHSIRILNLAAPWVLMGALCATGLADTEMPDGPDRGPSSLPFPLTSVVGDDYVMQPFDLVVFEVYNEPDTATQQRISASGEIRLPMLGFVHLKGLSVRSAEAKMEELYRSGGYFTNPQVILYVSQHTERTISVLGQVNRPDRIALITGTDKMGLSQAVALAGGLTRIAKASAIQITRIGTDGKEQRFEVNLDAYLNSDKSRPSADFQLQPDDIVFVPERVL